MEIFLLCSTKSNNNDTYIIVDHHWRDSMNKTQSDPNSQSSADEHITLLYHQARSALAATVHQSHVPGSTLRHTGSRRVNCSYLFLCPVRLTVLSPLVLFLPASLHHSVNELNLTLGLNL